jgi:glycosyltransferase involved in cell wall biosynthesis
MSTPRVTIGLPLYNGQRFVAQTLDSLLAQDFKDFEIVVSDNASTDASVTVVERYVQRDSRVRLLRQSVNLGANGNFSAVVHEARGEYFKWSTCSDLCNPGFLSSCVDLLDTQSDAVLAAPRTFIFTDDPARAQPYPNDIEVRDAAPSARFIRVNQTLKLNNAMNGLIRTHALRKLDPPIDHYIKADLVMISCLALQSAFHIAEGAHFFRRMDPQTATSLMSVEDDRKHHYPVMSARALLPTWRLYLGWLRYIRQAPVAPAERHAAMRYVLHMGRWERASFARDLLSAAGYLLRLRWMGGR